MTERGRERDENVRCPITGGCVTALVARLNVVGGQENMAGPRVDCLSDLQLSWLGLRRGLKEGTRTEEEGGKVHCSLAWSFDLTMARLITKLKTIYPTLY